MKKTKEETYELLMDQLEAVLDGETNLISIMSTLSGVLKQSMGSFYWVGFYLEDQGVLKVGPYQGTLGCLTIEHDRGVCGRAYRTGITQIVDDVHADAEHIACDPASVSEIVVPVMNSDGSVFAVFDIDSTIKGNFDNVDQSYLEKMIKMFLERHL